MTVRGDRIRFAVVGLGYWGPNIVRVLHELQPAEVATACDLDDARLKRIGHRYPSIGLTSSYEDVLADDSIDAVAVVTSVSTHYPLALAALEAGKHVFIEKPMAASLEEAEHLYAVATERGLTIMPGHTFLYSPPVNLVKELIESGELGEIYFVSTSRVNLGLHQSDVSVIWDLGPHDFSILRYWFGCGPRRASAMTRSCILDGIPDIAFVDLEYGSKMLAHVELSWLAPSKLRRTAIVGSQKMVVYDDTSNEPVRIFDSGADLPDPSDFGQYRLSYRTGDILSPRVTVAEPLSLEMADFCAAIADGVEPRSSGQVGLDVLRTIDAVDQSVALGGVPVDVAASVFV